MKNCTQKLLTLVLITMLAIIGNTFMLLKGFENSVMAEFTPEAISITNGNFEQNATSFPVAPNSFTTVGADTVAVKGIISLDDTKYQNFGNEYCLETRPTKFNVNFDNQMLLINSQNILSKFGFKSSELALKSNSYYEISVYVLTKYGTTASIVVSGTEFDNNANAKKLNISTNGVWSLYTIYIETNSIKNTTANLELWIGSSVAGSNGYVLFDNATIKNITPSTYSIAKNSTSTQNSFVSLKNTPIISESFENYTIDSTNVLYGKTNTAQSEVNITVHNLGTDNANMFQNAKALSLTTTAPGAIGLNLIEFTAERFNLYRVSIFAKTNLTSGTANIILKTNNPYGEGNTTYTPETKKLSVNTDSLTDNSYDNWIEYAFYIKGDPFFNRTITVELWLGDDEQTALGNVLFDNFAITKLITADYLTGKANENSAELILNDGESVPSLANDFFNYVNLKNETVNYPLVPENWSHYEKESNGAKFGIITSTTSVQGETVPNNILMLENTGANYQYVKSNTSKLPASTKESISYSKFVVYAKTQNTTGVGASIVLKSEDKTIAEFTQINSNTWQKYEFHIKNGIFTQNLNLYLQLGNEFSNITGKAYFDNASFKTTDETAFNSAKEASSAYTKVLDLSEENFEIVCGSKTNYVYAPALWTSSPSINGVTAGIINTAEFETGLGITNPDAGNPNTHKNVLMIKANQNVYYSYTNNLNINLITNNFYKISVWVKTANISAENNNQEDSNLKIGASISLNNISEKFTGINTYDAGALENAWVEYIFFIKATNDITSNLVLSLGNTEANASGEAYFDNIVISEITQNQYNAAKQNETTIVVGNTDDIEEDDETETSTGTNFDWVLIPTLLTALSLIFAIISYSLRKTKFVKNISKRNNKKSNVVKTESFDRNKTITKQYEKRLSIAKSKKYMEDLTAQINKIEQELNETELKFEAFLIETNNIENNKSITNEEIQKYIDTNPQIDFDYEFDSENQKLKKENELLFNRTYYEVTKQNLNEEKQSVQAEIEKLKN